MPSEHPRADSALGVSVAELVRGEAPAYASAGGESAQHGAGWGGLPASSAGEAVDHAEQGSDGHGAADSQPGFELFEAPVVHPDLAAPAAFPAANENGAPATVAIELVEVERFLDAQSGAPEDDDQRTGAGAVLGVLAAAHDGDDLLGARWVGREVAALIRGPAFGLASRARDGRPAHGGRVQQR
jgi:hypothetical protein